MKPKALLKVAKTWVIGHGPQIATGIGIALAFAAGVKAVKETPKAVKAIEEKKEEKKKEENTEELTVVETVQTTWKYYAMPVGMFLASAILIIGAQRATARKAAAFATAYQLSEQMLQEYKDAAKEVVGEKKAKDIQDQAAIQQVQKNPPVANNIIITGKGNQLCLDALSNHYFYSNAEHIRQDANRVITQAFADNVEFVPLSDWYYQINLREAMDMELLKDASDTFGWNKSDGQVEPVFTSTLGTGEFENIPILVVSFNTVPHPDKNDVGRWG